MCRDRDPAVEERGRSFSFQPLVVSFETTVCSALLKQRVAAGTAAWDHPTGSIRSGCLRFSIIGLAVQFSVEKGPVPITLVAELRLATGASRAVKHGSRIGR